MQVTPSLFSPQEKNGSFFVVVLEKSLFYSKESQVEAYTTIQKDVQEVVLVAWKILII